LIQLLLQETVEPPSARGPYATGRSAGERIYKVADGWIFAQAPHDMSAELAPLTAAAALADLAARQIAAVPVQTLKELVERHRVLPTRTVRFEKRERDGWANECFAPTWFAIDGVANARPSAPPRIGSDAPAILAGLGYTASEIERLEDAGIVGPIEWYRRSVVTT
jgi:hypothetical protein